MEDRARAEEAGICSGGSQAGLEALGQKEAAKEISRGKKPRYLKGCEVSLRVGRNLEFKKLLQQR